jgi:hypothetical protein
MAISPQVGISPTKLGEIWERRRFLSKSVLALSEFYHEAGLWVVQRLDAMRLLAWLKYLQKAGHHSDSGVFFSSLCLTRSRCSGRMGGYSVSNEKSLNYA